MNRSFCQECLKKQLKIDELTEENERLKRQLRYRKRKQEEGFFGSSTPSSKLPVKPNTPQAPANRKRPGAKPGHTGAGRASVSEEDAEHVVQVEPVAPTGVCPECGGALIDKGVERRTVLESRPVKVERVVYRLPEQHCPRCRRTFRARAPSVLPKTLYGNQALATAAAMHYLHGVPMGRVCGQMGIEPGSLVQAFHRLAAIFAPVPQKLIKQYRRAPVKHADETGWRTNGRNGYVWLFATPDISIFQFLKTRSGKVPRAVLGNKSLPGTLVVDRYAAYNRAPCKIQYCYSHLSRDIHDLQKEFPESSGVATFTSTLAPLLSLAMGLRSQKIPHEQFYERASALTEEILQTVNTPAHHAGVRYIQDIFRDNPNRLYHWAEDRRVPADNNLAERDLRPTVIARKTSFGSQSDAGAKTRSVLMTVLHTLSKRGLEPAAQLKTALDKLAHDISQDPFHLLFPRDSPHN
jgi:transposase